jgi:transposase
MRTLKRLTTDEIYKLYEAGPDTIAKVVNTLIDSVYEQKEIINQLKELVKKLEEQINKNSKNSSKPPSTDGFNKPRSLRKKGLKPNGGQKGHEGHTLNQVDNPDKIVTHNPIICKKCGHLLNNTKPVNCEKPGTIWL